jgi:chaperonin GroEL
MSLFEKTKAKSITADRAKIQTLVSNTLEDMAAIVGATLGPGGRPVIIEREGLSPLVTKDGVTVARSLGIANAEANIIVEAAKEICLNTAKEAGDGTTTAIVLANAITKHGMEFLTNNPKYNPQRMVNELNNLYDSLIVPFLKDHAKEIKSKEELINVAKISANGDLKIAEVVVDAVMAAGEDGHILIEEAQGNQLRVETMNGFIVTSGLKDLGSLGPAFINDRANQQAKMDKGLVFLYDGTMNDLKVPGAIQQILENTEYFGMPLMVFAHGFADVVLDRFAKTTKGGYTVVPIKTPLSGVANSRSMFLRDMSAYTGAAVHDPGTIDAFIDDANNLSDFGMFETAKANMYETVVTSDPDSDRLDARVQELKSIAAVANELDKMHIKAAIGKLVGGIATIWVGAASELEAREKKARVEDAVEAVKSAIAEGIIPGGCGVALVLSDIIARHPDKKESWGIMAKALVAPFKLLLSNCGENIDTVWPAISPYIEGKDAPPEFIFDAEAHKMVDPMTSGIIEPAKVCRVSVGNALSVASLLITLGGLVVVPRNSSLEDQLALSKQAFRDMMDPASGLMGQE